MSDVMETKAMDGNFGSASQPDSFVKKWLERQISAGCRDGVFTVTVDLTPELAALLVGANPDNRRISEWKVQKYAYDIASGRWDHNGEPVIIANTGELNDGQHRCLAVIAAGKAMLTQMTFGVARDTRFTVDIGMKRTSAQHIAMRGQANGTYTADAVGAILTYKKLGRFSTSGMDRPTPPEILDWMAAHPEIKDYVQIGARAARALRASRGLFGALYYLFAEISIADANTFFERLESGVGIEKGDPIHTLRSQLINNIGSSSKITKVEIAARTIKAWNHFRAGTSVKYLRRRKRGPAVEGFPVPE